LFGIRRNWPIGPIRNAGLGRAALRFLVGRAFGHFAKMKSPGPGARAAIVQPHETLGG